MRRWIGAPSDDGVRHPERRVDASTDDEPAGAGDLCQREGLQPGAKALGDREDDVPPIPAAGVVRAPKAVARLFDQAEPPVVQSRGDLARDDQNLVTEVLRPQDRPFGKGMTLGEKRRERLAREEWLPLETFDLAGIVEDAQLQLTCTQAPHL